MSDSISERVLQFIANNYSVDRDSIVLEESLIDQGIIDSIGLIEISTFIEKEFGFSVKEEERDVEIYRIDPETRDRQLERLRQIREERDGTRVTESLKRLELAAKTEENIIPHLFEPLKAQATLGEIASTLKKVYGQYKEPKTV